MLKFKKWIKVSGYATAILLFLILALIFFDIVAKQTSPNRQIMKIENKAQANSVDIWRISNKGRKRYRLKAVSMDKRKNGVMILHKAQLWYFEYDKPTIYLKADEAKIYTNNNVDAFGHIYLKRKDLNLYAKSVKWYDSSKIVESKQSFKGYNKKSSFSGKSFIYYQYKDELVVAGVDIWLK